MITIYGIKNCDTMQKAMKWMDAKGIKYVFHDYREKGVDATKVKIWLQHLPADKLINLRSTTYRELPEAEKDISTQNKAIKLMMAHNSAIKRPLWELDNGQYFLGWDEKKLSELLIR